MNDRPVAQCNASTDGVSTTKFLVCLNGYPQKAACTFEEALSEARIFRRAFVEEATTIYDVETGIHFEVLE
jgi:hypothetical protein